MRACGLLGLSLAAMLTVPLARSAQVADASAPDCSGPASAACYFSFDTAGGAGRFHYYASRVPGAVSSDPGPTVALVALHGHPRDANKTFNAARLAVTRAGAADQTLVVAPVFQVNARQARRCETPGVPAAQAGDLLWTCQSWMEGGAATGQGLSSFAAMDALVAELARQWPSLRSITIAGFSAGAQMVQHYIGFAATLPAGAPAVRYVVSDPGTWLYFDAARPQPMRDGLAADWASCSGGPDFLGGCSIALKAVAAVCPVSNQWKYGTDSLPAWLGRSAAEARTRYAAADISYLAGALDSGSAPGTFYKILDKSCAAQAQGPYRLQRGLAYAAYDRALLTPTQRRRVTVVPGCAHDVACVFPSEAARAALLGP